MWHEDLEQVGQIFVDYFDQLFSTSQPRMERELLNAILPKVLERRNATLTKEFHAGEVEKALKQMHPLTVPSLDGVPPLFYQHFWPTIKSIVIITALNFLNHGIAPPQSSMILTLFLFQRQRILKE